MGRLGIVLATGWLLFGATALAGPRIGLAAFPPTLRIGQEGPIEGAAAAELAGARGEYESVQVAVTALDGGLKGVNVSMGSLRSTDGREVAPECVVLYREAYVPVRHSAPRATCPPGLVADPLIPFKNPYTGESIPEPRWHGDEREGPRFGAAGFEVWQDRHQPLWMDVRIPRDAVPGLYEGTLRVTADGAAAAEMPVRVTVWDFTLPEGPTHENHFGGVEGIAGHHHLKTDSEAYQRLEERYAEMLAEHRINPAIPGRLLPKPGPDGALQVDEATDRALSDFVARYHVTNIGIPHAPFGDALGADRGKALRFFQSWQEYLEKKGWLERAYHYMLDEPNDPEAYERVRSLGALVHEAAPRLRRLVVEQPYCENPAWGALDGAIDLWCPLFGFIHEPSVRRVQAQGNAVWSYTALVQSAPPYHPEFDTVKGDNPPYWQIDFPVTAYRIAPWLNRRYGVTGLLYWSCVYWGSPDRNPWDDPGFRIRWNGDGFLFYPGDDAGIEGPVASIRLKNLRDGMEDFEYFVLLEQRGGREVVEELVRTAVPTWGSWAQGPGTLPGLRQRLAEAILRGGK